MSEQTQALLRDYGERAYEIAVRLATAAVAVGDTHGAELYGQSARELLQANRAPKPASHV